MRSFFTLATVVYAAAIGGCGFFTDFDDYSVADDAGVSTPYSMFVDNLAVAVCDRAVTCEGKYTSSRNQQMACGHIPSEAETSLFEHFMESFAPHGAERFDTTLAATCVAAVSAVGCDADVLPAPCGFLRAGTGVLDTGCVSDADCESGRCEGAPLTCGSRVCAALAASTEACSDSWDCAAGLVCAEGTCQATKNLGDACTVDWQCGPDAWCDDIDGTGACAGRPDVEAEACAIHGGNDPCAPGLYCVGGACVRGANANAACSEAMPCGPGLRCVSNACTPIVDRGAACLTLNDCPEFFECVSSVCTPRPVSGQPCSASRVCVVGSCQAGVCAVPTPGSTCLASPLPFAPVCEGYCNSAVVPTRCVAKKVEGMACGSDSECAANSCVGGFCDDCVEP